MKISLAGSVGIEDITARWVANGSMARLWAKDHTVWSPERVPELVDRLGWLTLPETAVRHVPRIERLRERAVAEGVTTIALCGMGGSSLAPEVFATSLPAKAGHPELVVVDSTHPDTLMSVLEAIDMRRTWFIIASKSGGTLETLSFMRLFWSHVAEVTETPGERFIAITDPGSSLEAEASARNFMATFLADPEVGGRYSALSAFGLVPAGLTGIDIGPLLAEGSAAAQMCGPETPLAYNPGFSIGATLAAAAASGRDKARFVGTGLGATLGIWAEQLIAESTGKEGTGIVPVDNGPDRPTAMDEVVISVGLCDADADVSISLDQPADLAAAMYILEMATAVAGAELGIHPFNQPDVQRAKTLADQAMNGSLELEADATAIHDQTVARRLNDLLANARSYVAIQAYLAPTAEADGALSRLRAAASRSTGLATTVGYGPRFLHSTGQLHKGGPSGGVYLQIVDRPSSSLAVPETDFTFNTMIAAQAAGDRIALEDAGRTALTIDVGDEPAAGIVSLANVLGRAV